MQRRLSLAVGSLLVGLPIHLLWGLPDSNPANFTSFLFAIASLVIFAYAISKHKIFYTKYRYELRLLANILMMNIVLKYAIPRFALTSNILDVMVDFIGTYIIDLGEYMCTSTCSDLITLACAAALLDYALRTTLMVEDAARFYNSLEIIYDDKPSCRHEPSEKRKSRPHIPIVNKDRCRDRKRACCRNSIQDRRPVCEPCHD